jgi:magnesium transporter
LSERIGPQNLEDPVSAHLRSDCVRLRQDQTVAQVLTELRGREPGEKIVYFYVVDAEGRLVGVVPTRRLLMSVPEATIGTIMYDRVVGLPASSSVLDACELFIAHRFLALPVVDDERRLLGVVDVNLFTDEVLSLAERRSAESVFQMIGVHLALGRSGSPLTGFRDRFPWLLCNIAGGIGCALLASLYEPLLDAAIVLAVFIPVVLALSESVSIQSMTLTLQALQHERVNWGLFARNLRRELLTALLLGTACGLVIGGAVMAWRAGPLLASSVALAIALAMTTSCLLSVLITTAVRVLRMNPRVAAGPVVLALGDMATLLFYFGLAARLLRV